MRIVTQLKSIVLKHLRSKPNFWSISQLMITTNYQINSFNCRVINQKQREKKNIIFISNNSYRNQFQWMNAELMQWVTEKVSLDGGKKKTEIKSLWYKDLWRHFDQTDIYIINRGLIRRVTRIKVIDLNDLWTNFFSKRFFFFPFGYNISYFNWLNPNRKKFHLNTYRFVSI